MYTSALKFVDPRGTNRRGGEARSWNIPVPVVSSTIRDFGRGRRLRVSDPGGRVPGDEAILCTCAPSRKEKSQIPHHNEK